MALLTAHVDSPSHDLHTFQCWLDEVAPLSASWSRWQPVQRYRVTGLLRSYFDRRTSKCLNESSTSWKLLSTISAVLLIECYITPLGSTLQTGLPLTACTVILCGVASQRRTTVTTTGSLSPPSDATKPHGISFTENFPWPTVLGVALHNSIESLVVKFQRDLYREHLGHLAPTAPYVVQQLQPLLDRVA